MWPNIKSTKLFESFPKVREFLKVYVMHRRLKIKFASLVNFDQLFISYYQLLYMNLYFYLKTFWKPLYFDRTTFQDSWKVFFIALGLVFKVETFFKLISLCHFFLFQHVFGSRCFFGFQLTKQFLVLVLFRHVVTNIIWVVSGIRTAFILGEEVCFMLCFLNCMGIKNNNVVWPMTTGVKQRAPILGGREGAKAHPL